MSSHDQNVLYLDNDNDLILEGLKWKFAGTFVNDAVVTGRIKDAAGVDVPGVAWPVTMDYQTGSDGDYVGTADKAVTLVTGTRYFAHIDAVKGSADGHWELPVVARVRRKL